MFGYSPLFIPGGRYNIEHPPEIHLRHISRKISFVQDYIRIQLLILKFCTEHGSVTAVLCAKFQNDWMMGMGEINERDLCLRWVWAGCVMLRRPEVPQRATLYTCRVVLPSRYISVCHLVHKETRLLCLGGHLGNVPPPLTHEEQLASTENRLNSLTTPRLGI